MSELPSAQLLPVELLPPPPPSADNPELCAELDDVGDHELSYKTRGKSISVFHPSLSKACDNSSF